MKPKHNDDIIRMMDDGAGIEETARALGYSRCYVSECRTNERERRARENRLSGVLYDKFPADDAPFHEWVKYTWPVSSTFTSRTLDGKPLHEEFHKGGGVTYLVKRMRRIVANG